MMTEMQVGEAGGRSKLPSGLVEIVLLIVSLSASALVIGDVRVSSASSRSCVRPGGRDA